MIHVARVDDPEVETEKRIHVKSAHSEQLVESRDKPVFLDLKPGTNEVAMVVSDPTNGGTAAGAIVEPAEPSPR